MVVCAVDGSCGGGVVLYERLRAWRRKWVGASCRRRRTQRGWTQGNIAWATGLSVATISRIEAGNPVVAPATVRMVQTYLTGRDVA
jgi:hypothetical protein